MRNLSTAKQQLALLRRVQKETERFQLKLSLALTETEITSREPHMRASGRNIAALKRASMDLSHLLVEIRGTRKDAL